MVASGRGYRDRAGGRDRAGVPHLQADTVRARPGTAPEPAYEDVTEMVPCTVMRTRTKVEMVPAYSKTVMQTKFETVNDIQTVPTCKQVFDTVFKTKCVTVCRPVVDSTMECQRYCTFRCVTTTRKVTEYQTKAYTELVTVPVKDKCSRCGHTGGGCTCRTVARTCYKKVPVTREVCETQLVPEVKTQLVPVAHWRLVPEQVIERVPVTVCHMERDVITIKMPRLVIKHVPKVLIYKKAAMIVEEYPVTVYRPVVKRVPVVGPSSWPVPRRSDRPRRSSLRPATEEKDAAQVPAEPEGAVSPFAPATPRPPTPAPPPPAPGGGAAPASVKPPKAAG